MPGDDSESRDCLPASGCYTPVRVWDWEMEDASLEHPWNWHLGLCCNFTMVLMELGPTMVPGPMVLPILGQSRWDRDCCPCVCMCGAYKGALISVGASGPCHNAEIMSLLLSAHSTSSLRWLASSSRQNLPRLKWMCHHLPQQIRSPLMMGQTPLARRATAVIQAPFFFSPSSLCSQFMCKLSAHPRPQGKCILVGMGSPSPSYPPRQDQCGGQLPQWPRVSCISAGEQQAPCSV